MLRAAGQQGSLAMLDMLSSAQWAHLRLEGSGSSRSSASRQPATLSAAPALNTLPATLATSPTMPACSFQGPVQGLGFGPECLSPDCCGRHNSWAAGCVLRKERGWLVALLPPKARAPNLASQPCCNPAPVQSRLPPRLLQAPALTALQGAWLWHRQPQWPHLWPSNAARRARRAGTAAPRPAPQSAARAGQTAARPAQLRALGAPRAQPSAGPLRPLGPPVGRSPVRHAAALSVLLLSRICPASLG